MAVRPAREADVPTIVRFIRELADYEQLLHEVKASESALREHLFGARPACAALIAEVEAEAVGFALYFQTYSTFETAVCLHLEDLYVTPEQRGAGHGKALLAAVAARARELGCPRLQWNVLDWNAPAIAFYESLGAGLLREWETCRLDAAGIARIAGASD